MDRNHQTPQTLLDLTEARIAYRFRDANQLCKALTHRSFSNENPDESHIGHNERLEFLGDAVLNLIISQMLMNVHPEVSEGDLSRMRAALVNERDLARTAAELGLGDLMRLGKGEERSGGREKPSLLANLFEALLGALYLDGGFEAALAFIHSAMARKVEVSLESAPIFDPKSQLQEIFQQQGRTPPRYLVVEMEGPEHRKRFTVCVMSGETELARATGTSKKEAEQTVARLLLQSPLQALPDQTPGQNPPEPPEEEQSR